MLVAASRRVWLGVSSANRFRLLDLTCFIVGNNTLTHEPYVLPNVEGIVSAKPFSMGTLSLLTNF